MGALAGIRVLDLSRVLAGPWCAQTLADLGAEVIKVERLGLGDDTRGWGPPWRGLNTGDERDSAYFLSANRNKSSIAIDFSKQKGASLLRDLAAQSDILIENFKAGSLAQYGLSYEALQQANPRLVYCSITGFGQHGPYSSRAGYDFLIQGMGGLMSITGLPDGEPGAGPQKTGVALTDIMTGMYAATGILAALMESKKTGQGQHVDISLLDVQIASLANQAMNYLVSGEAPKRLGNAHPNIVPYQDFRTRDGYMILAIGNDSQFKKFSDLCNRADWSEDARFSTNAGRVQNREALIREIAEVVVTRDTTQWITALEAVGVPCGPINTIEEVFADPHVQQRGALQHIPSHHKGLVPTVANPLRLSRTPVEYRSAPPALGQDTIKVLKELLGISSPEVQALVTEGVIQAS